ncbi:hypothetical protein, partial [Klebsiella michiganensis]|uniref:hypothetical protein n=1 Tax=Klebsiella michiganensis TaxID=1134687 RepID=UPI001E512151
PAMVAKQMELIVEGCLSRLLIKRSQTDVDTARRLAEDILRFARPDDELAIAQREGILHRNFQGYTTQGDTDLLGMGVSAISM